MENLSNRVLKAHMKKLLIIILLIFFSMVGSNAQYQERFWIMGRTDGSANKTNATFDFYPSNLTLYNFAGAPPAMNPAPIAINSDNGFEGWGGLIYSAANFLIEEDDQFWDGTHRGQEMNTGMFLYVVKVEYENKESSILSGGVLLLR